MFINFRYRVPSKGDQREKWIEAIQKHQAFQHSRIEFNVCMRHFKSSDYEQKGSKFVLNRNAIPSIFTDSAVNNVENCASCNSIDSIIGNEIIDDTIQNAKCVQCPFLLAKIAELKKEIFRLNANHSISAQKLEQKNLLLRQNAMEKSKLLKESEK